MVSVLLEPGYYRLLTVPPLSAKAPPSQFSYLAGSASTPNLDNWSRETLEFYWWSVVRFECLELSCYNDTSAPVAAQTMICTAALECLLQVLTSAPTPPTALPGDFQAALQTFFKRGLANAHPLEDYVSCKVMF